VQGWNGPAASSVTSVEDVKRRAEEFCRGISSKWIALGVSLEAEKAYHDEIQKSSTCSFCGKQPEEDFFVRGAREHSAVIACALYMRTCLNWKRRNDKRCCGVKTTNEPRKPNSSQGDHMESWVRGRKTTDENAANSCASCNSSKGSKELGTEWVPPRNR